VQHGDRHGIAGFAAQQADGVLQRHSLRAAAVNPQNPIAGPNAGLVRRRIPFDAVDQGATVNVLVDQNLTNATAGSGTKNYYLINSSSFSINEYYENLPTNSLYVNNQKITDNESVSSGNSNLYKKVNGEYVQEMKKNAVIWLKEQTKDLLFLHSRSGKPSKQFTSIVADVIAETLKNSTSGKIEWDEMCLMSTEPLDKLMYNEVVKLLK